MNRIVRFSPINPNVNNGPKQCTAFQRLAFFLATTAALMCTAASPLAHAQTETSPPPAEPPLTSLLVTGKCMGPIDYQVTVVDPPTGLTETELEPVVQATLDRINQRMSTYIDDSYVSQFNASKSTDFVACDAETARVVQRAIEISDLTNGGFDITVGPAVELWSFGRGDWQRGDSFEPPSDQAINKSLESVGYQKLTVRMDPPGIKKSHPDVQINLSAIAKGYAVDQVWEKLASMDCKNILVTVGGEVRASGHRADRTAWLVGVKQPDNPDDLAAIALVSDGALATSGDYENARRVGKKRYSHTIDPVTARPVEHNLASASILAGDCMTADALATAAMVMGRKPAFELLTQQGKDFYLIERMGDFSGQYKRYGSETFPFSDEKYREQLENHSPEKPKEKSSIWPVFIASLCMFGLMILAMAIGAIFNNKPVTGSCGGLANVTNEDGESSCAICSKPVTDCVEVTGAAETS